MTGVVTRLGIGWESLGHITLELLERNTEFIHNKYSYYIEEAVKQKTDVSYVSNLETQFGIGFELLGHMTWIILGKQPEK